MSLPFRAPLAFLASHGFAGPPAFIAPTTASRQPHICIADFRLTSSPFNIVINRFRFAVSPHSPDCHWHYHCQPPGRQFRPLLRFRPTGHWLQPPRQSTGAFVAIPVPCPLFQDRRLLRLSRPLRSGSPGLTRLVFQPGFISGVRPAWDFIHNSFSHAYCLIRLDRMPDSLIPFAFANSTIHHSVCAWAIPGHSLGFSAFGTPGPGHLGGRMISGFRAPSGRSSPRRAERHRAGPTLPPVFCQQRASAAARAPAPAGRLRAGQHRACRPGFRHSAWRRARAHQRRNASAGPPPRRAWISHARSAPGLWAHLPRRRISGRRPPLHFGHAYFSRRAAFAGLLAQAAARCRHCTAAAARAPIRVSRLSAAILFASVIAAGSGRIRQFLPGRSFRLQAISSDSHTASIQSAVRAGHYPRFAGARAAYRPRRCSIFGPPRSCTPQFPPISLQPFIIFRPSIIQFRPGPSTPITAPASGFLGLLPRGAGLQLRAACFGYAIASRAGLGPPAWGTGHLGRGGRAPAHGPGISQPGLPPGRPPGTAPFWLQPGPPGRACLLQFRWHRSSCLPVRAGLPPAGISTPAAAAAGQLLPPPGWIAQAFPAQAASPIASAFGILPVFGLTGHSSRRCRWCRILCWRCGQAPGPAASQFRWPHGIIFAG